MIGNLLNIKQLEALIWVVELGSFRKAAHHLNTTQPNISSRIAGLEKTLGVVLMHREAGTIELTPEGRDILLSARKILHHAEGIVEIANRQDLISDRLRLGVTELVACTWLHAYLRKIKAAYPTMNVELTVDLSHNLDTEFGANHLDLVIQTSPFHTQAHGIVELGYFPYLWVANNAIADALSGTQTISQLLPYSILTHARHTQAYTELVDHAQDQSISTSRFIASNSLASCVQMAADGMGVTLLPKDLVMAELSNGTLAVVDVDWLPTPLRFAARYVPEKSARYVAHTARLALDAVTEFNAR